MAEWTGLTRAAARQLAERVLALSKAEGCQVNISANAAGNTRYARNEVTTGGDACDVTRMGRHMPVEMNTGLNTERSKSIG